MDRHWLLTWTTYGTWLPGDRRGFVSNVRAGAGPEVRHNLPGTEYDANLPGLQRSAQRALTHEAVYLRADSAPLLLTQFQESAKYRGWALLAVAILPNHIHLVVGVSGDPEPASLLQTFKSYGSRVLNRASNRGAGYRWWTESGSRRKLPDERAVRAAVAYVRNQGRPLLVWTADDDNIGERGT